MVLSLIGSMRWLFACVRATGGAIDTDEGRMVAAGGGATTGMDEGRVVAAGGGGDVVEASDCGKIELAGTMDAGEGETSTEFRSLGGGGFGFGFGAGIAFNLETQPSGNHP